MLAQTKLSSTPFWVAQAIYLETTAAGGVTWEEVEESKLSPTDAGAEKKPKRSIKINIPKWCGKWVVSMDEYGPGIVGAKSKNLAGRAV
jgi:alpha-glucan,water dikinase